MIKKLQALRAKKGFTLVELIVVIAIIGVLAAILIPTLSGVIESSRKRSAESACQSIQNIAKAYASQYTAKKGANCTGADTETVDMDTGDADEPYTFKKYIESQIPKVKITDPKHAVNITLKNGKVTAVKYQEGAYVSEWTETTGLKPTGKTGDTIKVNGKDETISEIKDPGVSFGAAAKED